MLPHDGVYPVNIVVESGEDAWFGNLRSTTWKTWITAIADNTDYNPAHAVITTHQRTAAITLRSQQHSVLYRRGAASRHSAAVTTP